MKWIIFLASVIAAATTLSTEPVYANDLADVVRARANARAGGGTSGHDAWVLKRHGKLSGTSSRKRAASRRAAKKRALLAAKKKKAAAAKRRAYLVAKKKKQAQKQAVLAAKKKTAKKRARLAAQKKAAAKKRALSAAQKTAESQQKVAQVPETEKAIDSSADNAGASSDKTESSFVPASSTTALITSQEIEVDNRVRPAPVMGRNIAITDKTDAASEAAEERAAPVRFTAKEKEATSSAGSCKKFLPAIGLTVSVGC